MKQAKSKLSCRKQAMTWLVLLALSLVQTAKAQDEFLPTNYDEPYRGQWHFSQQSGWMNDINGLWYMDGTYYLTYQSFVPSLSGDPSGFALRDWGMATSTDMIHWKQQPNFLVSDDNVPGEVWSGSTVIDFNNKSGLGTLENPAILCFYTAAKRDQDMAGKATGTCIAYSTDKGATWKSYEQNPVNIASPYFRDRDPKVFWHEASGKWCCVIFEEQGGMTFYNSDDLLNWTKKSQMNWGWECPDFFELKVDGDGETKYVVLQGNADYFIGDFDGSTFTPDHDDAYEMVHNKGFGGTFYASQTFFPIGFPGDRIVQIGWMLGNGIGSTSPWTHNASFPCVLELKTTDEGVRIVRNPIEEIEKLHGSGRKWENKTLYSGQNLFDGVLSKSFDLEVVLDVSDAEASEVAFRFADKTFSYGIGSEKLLGYELKAKDGLVKMRFLVDWLSLEIFGNDGEYSYSENVRFNPEDYSIAMIADGKVKVVSATLTEMKRIWDGTPNNTYINNSDARNTYSGDVFHAQNEDVYYNRDCHVLFNGGAVECTFTGTNVTWYALKNDDLGFASVYIDGELKENIDCYSKVRMVQKIFSIDGLSDGEHTIKIVANGTKNESSNNVNLVHDYFGFIGKPGAASACDDASDKTTYTGTWEAKEATGFYQGTYHKNSTDSGDIQYTFSGTQVFWYGMKDADLGLVAVYIDDKLVADNIDCYAATPTTTCLFAQRDLTDGNHKIKVVAKNEKNAASTGKGFVHDYFNAPAAASGAVDNTSGRLKYTGAWEFRSGENIYHNGTCCYNTTNPASVELTFEGPYVAWYALQNNDLGFVRITIDGTVEVDELDCFSTDRRVRMFYEKTNLSEGTHTIKVETLGKKHNDSHGMAMVHDYFLVSPTQAAASIAIAGSLDFGDIMLDEAPSKKDIVITNIDLYPVQVSGITLPDGYTCNWTKGELQPGENKTISVTFTPTEMKSYQGKVIISSNFGTTSSDISGKGVEEVAIDQVGDTDIQLYPNPVKDKLFVSGNDLAQVEVFNLQGDELIKKGIQASDKAIAELDLSGIASGVLIIKVTKENKDSFTAKLIKM